MEGVATSTFIILLYWILPHPIQPRPEPDVTGKSFSIAQYGVQNNVSCQNGYLTGDGSCTCGPCWEGHNCHNYVDYYAPRFLVHTATAVLPLSATGVVYRAWSTDDDLGLTCPLGPGESARCPCAAITYHLFAPPGDHHFLMDSTTGLVTRNKNTTLHAGTTYTYKLMVQGAPVEGQSKDLFYDLLDLRIYVRADYIRKIPWIS